jgi:hypothetical protein
VLVFEEPGRRSFAPFAGLTPKTTWLTREGVLRALKQLPFGTIDVLSEREERNGLRIELIASR